MVTSPPAVRLPVFRIKSEPLWPTRALMPESASNVTPFTLRGAPVFPVPAASEAPLLTRTPPVRVPVPLSLPAETMTGPVTLPFITRVPEPVLSKPPLPTTGALIVSSVCVTVFSLMVKVRWVSPRSRLPGPLMVCPLSEVEPVAEITPVSRWVNPLLIWRRPVVPVPWPMESTVSASRQLLLFKISSPSATITDPMVLPVELIVHVPPSVLKRVPAPRLMVPFRMPVFAPRIKMEGDGVASCSRFPLIRNGTVSARRA